MKKCKLCEIAEVIMGQSPKSIHYNTVGNGIPFLQGNRTFGLLYPIFDTYTSHSIKLAKPNDILMSVRAPVGDLNFAPCVLCIGRGLCAIRSNTVDNNYLFYLMKFIVPKIINRETGTIFGSVNSTDINTLEIEIHEDKKQQQKIAKILSSLDEKIELNNKINENLHAQAQAIFKSWFVDFEPFGGTMPSDWEKGKLSDIVKVCYGKDHKKLENGVIPAYGSGGIIRYVEQFLYDKESVLIPRKGTLNNVFYMNELFWTVDTMFYTEMKREYLAKFIFYFVKGLNLEFMNVGSAVPSMTTAILNSLELFIPTEQILKNFDTVIVPLFNLIKNNDEENKKLAQIRDTLLPKLMSGELEV